ncbi:putative 37S ribosomal protein S18, mitochondrial [Colletotrichum tanaceti]|uniref:Putative 37S ribosomal protein S18, mitochondrial n=1 Tax=Colletotrichum tanaceti TaxID=1306861 RepID=A0A4V6DI90_9PEZI|nr:putative 37S ribosomal protein S18, mitochondrial [Colletotrichum tanaceti]TKW58866.1 putative 37S ribosomal protein S18, mitochondrial [Colletotrichum tanaceti]
MSSAPTTRLLAKSLFQNVAWSSPVARCSPVLLRSFSQTPRADEAKKGGQELLAAMYGTRAPATLPRSLASNTPSSTPDPTKSLLLDTMQKASSNPSNPFGSGLDDLVPDEDDLLEPYHMHVYSHKHNTHVTVTKPDRGAIISLSTGNIGFKKSRRKGYDAAYQLTAYVLEKLNYAGWQKKVNKLELVLRGFGVGRDAAVKVLMAPEGKIWKNKIVRVSDSTRLKFGGTRSKNPRRV